MKDFCVWALPNTYLMAIRLGGRLGLGLLICPKVRGVFRWHHGGGQGRPSLLWHVRRHGVGVEAGRVRRESTHTDRPRLPQDWGRRGARRHWLDGEINSQSCACSWPPQHPSPQPTCHFSTHPWPCSPFNRSGWIGCSGSNRQSMSVSPDIIRLNHKSLRCGLAGPPFIRAFYMASSGWSKWATPVLIFQLTCHMKCGRR